MNSTDIESFLQPFHDVLQHHVPASYSYYVKSDHPHYANSEGENI